MSSVFDKAFKIVSFVFLNPINQNIWEKNALKVLFCALNIICLFFCLVLAYSNLPLSLLKLKVLYIIGFFQTYVFIIVSFVLVVDFQVRGRFVLGISQFCSAKSKLTYFFSISVLLTVRFVKIILGSGRFKYISFTIMQIFPEIIISTNDLIYAVSICELSTEIKVLNNRVLSEKFLWKNLAKLEEMVDIHVMSSNSMNNFFSPRIFLTLVYNYFQLITSLYYIFIRQISNKLNTAEGYASFIFSVQPICCFIVIFFCVDSYLKEVIEVFIFYVVFLNFTSIHRFKNFLLLCCQNQNLKSYILIKQMSL